MVDLDAEKGRPPRDQPDHVYVVIRPAKIVRMAVLQAYLSRQMPFDKSILEAISRFPILTSRSLTNPFQLSLIMSCVNTRPKTTL